MPNKGVEIGFDKALYKNTDNMLLKGFPMDTIWEVLEVMPEYVARIRKELKRQATTFMWQEQNTAP